MAAHKHYRIWWRNADSTDGTYVVAAPHLITSIKVLIECRATNIRYELVREEKA